LIAFEFYKRGGALAYCLEILLLAYYFKFIFLLEGGGIITSFTTPSNGRRLYDGVLTLLSNLYSLLARSKPFILCLLD
jgi:hypothetical protein